MPLPVFTRRRGPLSGRAQGQGRAGERAQDDGRDLTAAELREVPRHFEAVAEALAADRDPADACAVAGTTLAADGASLGEALSGLATTFATFGLGEPTFAASEALSLAWSEETLHFLNDISCEDPLTGLASGAHLRARLSEVYRDVALAGATPRTTHALLVVDLRPPQADDRSAASPARDPFEQALGVAAAAELVRDAFPGGETLARVGADKVVALVRRNPDLGLTATRLRDVLEHARVAERPRVWIEGLPDTVDNAVGVIATLSLR